jgi:hypothetical protein
MPSLLTQGAGVILQVLPQSATSPRIPAGYGVTEKSDSLQTFAIVKQSYLQQYRGVLRLSKLVGLPRGVTT